MTASPTSAPSLDPLAHDPSPKSRGNVGARRDTVKHTDLENPPGIPRFCDCLRTVAHRGLAEREGLSDIPRNSLISRAFLGISVVKPVWLPVWSEGFSA